MKTLVELEIAGFYVPDVVCGKAFPSPIPMAPAVPFAPRPAQNPFEIPLSKLTPEALDELCRDFRKSVFQKAGKEQPPASVDISRARELLRRVCATAQDVMGDARKFDPELFAGRSVELLALLDDAGRAIGGL